MLNSKLNYFSWDLQKILEVKIQSKNINYTQGEKELKTKQ